MNYNDNIMDNFQQSGRIWLKVNFFIMSFFVFIITLLIYEKIYFLEEVYVSVIKNNELGLLCQITEVVSIVCVSCALYHTVNRLFLSCVHEKLQCQKKAIAFLFISSIALIVYEILLVVEYGERLTLSFSPFLCCIIFIFYFLYFKGDYEN